jgi:hypothetical protein
MEQGYILITGASSGIGEGLARAFANQNKNLILVARREDRLQKPVKDFPQLKIHAVSWDLDKSGSAKALFEHCQSQGWQVEGLVNNAGLGFQKDLTELTELQLHQMIQVNQTSLTEMCYFFLPQMQKRKEGFVLNVSSTASLLPLPHFSVYAATKAYVRSLSEALYIENKPFNVHVGCLCPGPVHTEFQQVAGIEPRFFASAQSVDSVVKVTLKGLKNKDALTWSSCTQGFFSVITSFMPRAVLRYMGGKTIEQARTGKISL